MVQVNFEQSVKVTSSSLSNRKKRKLFRLGVFGLLLLLLGLSLLLSGCADYPGADPPCTGSQKNAPGCDPPTTGLSDNPVGGEWYQDWAFKIVQKMLSNLAIQAVQLSVSVFWSIYTNLSSTDFAGCGAGNGAGTPTCSAVEAFSAIRTIAFVFFPLIMLYRTFKSYFLGQWIEGWYESFLTISARLLIAGFCIASLELIMTGAFGISNQLFNAISGGPEGLNEIAKAVVGHGWSPGAPPGSILSQPAIGVLSVEYVVNVGLLIFILIICLLMALVFIFLGVVFLLRTVLVFILFAMSPLGVLAGTLDEFKPWFFKWFQSVQAMLIAPLPVAAASPLAQARAASEQAQATAEALVAAQPPAVKYSEDMTAFQTAYDGAKQRKERGEPPIPFITENATGGLGARGSGRGFGVELEFDMSHLGGSKASAARQRIGQELHAAGLTTTPRQEGYHSSTDYTRWRFEQDCTVDGEIISPIMYDTPEDWEKLQKVCEIVQRNGGKATTRTGGHVHVACGNYDHTPKNHNNLLKLVKKNEDLVYRMSANPERGKHRGTRWCSPNQLPERDFTSVDSVRQTYNSHGLGVNFQSVQGRDSDHVEFRMYDGSLDPAIIQSQIKLSLGITDAALRHESNAFGAIQERLGTHKTNNRGAGRLEGAAWENDTQNVRQLLDTIFSREEDKAQAASLFATTKWQN